MPQAVEFFRNHPLLVMAFMAIVTALAWTFVAGRSQGIRRLAPNDVTRLINSEDAVVVDVRPDAEFRAGHIINSLSLPEKQLESNLKKLHKHRGKPIIVVCKMGQLSAKAGAVLKREGFENVSTLAGGLSAWEGAGLPLSKK